MSDPFIFKVMRLPSPSFRLVSSCASAIDGAHGDALTSLLQVSNSIGTVYCGEIFRCAVCAIANPTTPNAVYESVVIRCELHTTSARSPCGECAADTMSAGDKRELAVEHALGESGMNCLVAAVSFNVAGEERRDFKKFFKFSVFDAVTFAAAARAHYERRLVVDCAVTNNTQKTIQIYAISLRPTRTGISARAVAGISGGGDKSGAISLSSGASMNALFEVDDHGDTDIGRVHVKWRSLIGECGKVKSAMIQRPNARAPASRDVEWSVVHAPATAVIEEPFDVAIRIRQTAPNAPSPLSVRVSFIRERLGQIVPFGAAQAKLLLNSADAAADLVLSLLPIQVGVQKIGGLRIALSANGVPMSAFDVDTLHYVDVRPKRLESNDVNVY